jgi:5-formyltetrahydrofolate cyclo-ligase
MLNVKTAKQLLREEIWNKLETEGIAIFPLPCYGRIPNFVGSDKAAEKVRLLGEWKGSKAIFSNPDYAQQRIREYALLDGKTLVMASPGLRSGYIVIDPKDVKGVESSASTIKGAFKYGKAVGAQEIQKLGLIIEGSVAVDKQGHRLGKGRGYGDVEIGILKRMFGFIPIVTTVHDIQIVESVPFEEKDERVSIVVTPTKIIRIQL